jgi:hypothetical protein
MNPMLIMALASAAASMYSAHKQGQPGEQKSSYSPGAQGGLEDALKMVQQMKGGSDIRQNQQYQQGNEWFNSLFNDPEFFKSFEAPARRQFEEEIVPGVANRFAAQGSGGSLGSTGFRNQMAREGSNLETNLAAMRGGMQQQAIPQMLGYAQQPFQNYQSLLGTATQPTQNIYQPPNAGGMANILQGLSGAFMQGYGNSPNSGGGEMYRGYPGQYPTTY